MAETYCGKSCELCVQKEGLQCPGCKVGPGRAYGGDCELAKCVRVKGHETCDTCTTRGHCSNFRNCQHFPEYRRRKLEAERQKQETMARQAPLFGKWLWILFWLVVPNTIAGLFGNEMLWQSVPGVYGFGQIFKTACSLVYSMILLKLGAEERCYRTAGICGLISSVLGAVTGILAGTTEQLWLSAILVLPALIVAFVGEYNEYMGHSAILEPMDRELSEKWQTLWKWYISLFLGLFGCVLLAVIAPVLGLLALLGDVIGILVVCILKLVNLYRTAKVFRECTASLVP